MKQGKVASLKSDPQDKSARPHRTEKPYPEHLVLVAKSEATEAANVAPVEPEESLDLHTNELWTPIKEYRSALADSDKQNRLAWEHAKARPWRWWKLINLKRPL